MRSPGVLAAATLLLALPAATGSAAPATPRCPSTKLFAQIVPGSPGAGQRYATLTFTNYSKGTCHLHGYPGAQLIRDGEHVPTDVVRNPATVTDAVLARGEAASSQLHWTVVASGDESTTGPCEPRAKRIRVTPPGALKAHRLEWHLGVVCDRGRIDVTPMAAG
jgi:hypothetical protein